ncbi:Rhamnulokinase [Pirellulimonas nuda]|uniref:Rhamnulokinase n=1 Tax=Pirellulimonas nuda TaxID=2528009 RepID=A0A518DJR7_9BACT|nr:rhamnulokinase family protein [Pirellulimonas nuda]QDU91724.1 Rhamnulokinase [Pirellulimonas nuda]
MASQRVYLGIDLGASGGRVLAGKYDGERLALREIHRFPNGPVRIGNRLHWDFPGLWREVQDGLRLAAQRYGDRIASVGVDSWGVDYGLLSADDELLGNPYHYRDGRTRGGLERAFATVSRDEIFAATGLQFMELNTLYQLLAARDSGSPLLASAQTLLLIPDLMHWLLCGVKAVEATNASTTQLFDPIERGWSRDLISRFGLPDTMFGRIVEGGTRLGTLLPWVAEQTGLDRLPVIAPGTHDTASAVVAAPGETTGDPAPSWCYLNCGTWSLMGVEVPRPIINDQVAQWNFTNEAGVFGTTRLLKNVTGLWLAQECRRVWNQSGGDYGWDELARLASEAPPLVSLVNPDDPRFGAPTDMPAAIAEFCRETGQPAPASPGATIRCALESMALRSSQVLVCLEQLIGRRIETIQLIGGGVQNELLCQLTADACGRTVLAGPVEATALGNIIVQAIAMGDLAGVAEGRALVRSSFAMKRYEPRDAERWREARDRAPAEMGIS